MNESGRCPSGRSAGLRPEPVPVSALRAAATNAEAVSYADLVSDLDSASAADVAAILALLSKQIDVYSAAVRGAEARYQKDRAKLAELMDAFIIAAQFTAKKSADALAEAQGEAA